MVITKDRIFQQIQQDSAAYDALSEALKDVLLKEVALIRGSYPNVDRNASAPHIVGHIQAV